LFVYSHMSNFSAIWWLSPLPVTGLQIWAYARRSGPLSREGSLSCHTYCDTGPGLYGLIRKTDTHVLQWDSNLISIILILQNVRNLTCLTLLNYPTLFLHFSNFLYSFRKLTWKFKVFGQVVQEKM
jgi:hypothetical protein